MALFSTLCFSKDLAVFVKKVWFENCQRAIDVVYFVYVSPGRGHNIFQFFVALLKNFPTSSNSLKNAMEMITNNK